MFYNGNVAKVVYEYKNNVCSSLFEKMAFKAITKLCNDAEIVIEKVLISASMYANGAFEYRMAAYTKESEKSICYYSIENTYKVCWEDIYFENILTYHKGKYDTNALIWDGNFFGINTNKNEEEIMVILKDYSL